MGCLYIKPSMHDLIAQMETYNPDDSSQHDDILDALAMAITSINPAAREFEGDYTIMEEEEGYTPLRVGACP